MKDKIKKTLIHLLLIIINLGSFYLSHGENFGAGLSPHNGLLLISGLIFGPYGAVGSVMGNVLCDLSEVTDRH